SGDQEHGVGALEGLPERDRVIEVGAADVHAAFGEVGEFSGVPAGGGDVPGRVPPLQEGLDDEAAQVAGGTGDDDGHAVSLRGGPGSSPGGSSVSTSRSSITFHK